MSIPHFTMRQLLEAGVHFGHMVRRWNPRMAPFIHSERDGIHIIDLQQTVPMLYAALAFLREVAAGGGRVLFVGTKRQAQRPVEEHALRCGQHYVNQRWLGGMLTNWKTISKSIDRLKQMEQRLEEDEGNLPKKEVLNLQRQRVKLLRSLGGIREMGGLPDAMVVVDTNHERIAVAEARSLGIPVIAVLDTNSDPVGIDYPIPGNDDATRAVILYCELAANAVLGGLEEEQKLAGVDVGASEEGGVGDTSLDVGDETAEADTTAPAALAADAAVPVEPPGEAAATAPVNSSDEAEPAAAGTGDETVPEEAGSAEVASEEAGSTEVASEEAGSTEVASEEAGSAEAAPEETVSPEAAVQETVGETEQ